MKRGIVKVVASVFALVLLTAGVLMNARYVYASQDPTPLRASVSARAEQTLQEAEEGQDEQEPEEEEGQEEQESVESGIVIVSVDPDGPAAAAGVERGDILLRVDGESVDSLIDLRNVLAEREEGDEVRLTVERGDDVGTLTVTLEERARRPYLGLRACGDFHFLEELPALTEEQGVQIEEVLEDSPAAEAGLQEGDRILAIDGDDVHFGAMLAEAVRNHEPGDQVTLEVEGDDGETREVRVELGENPDAEEEAYLGIRLAPHLPLRFERAERFLDQIPFDQLPFQGRFRALPGFELPEGDSLLFDFDLEDLPEFDELPRPVEPGSSI
ncbi:MAG: PDZ domain-containing protein [Chloroflexota bacterium]|nr:PDZ domain-containing protein [Chloroflexota bacterium]